MKRLSALAAALMLGATPAIAKKAEQRRFTPIPSAPAVTLDPAKAYLIIRCKGHPKCIPPILMRVPSAAEVADHKARGTELGNVHVFNQKTAFETSATGATYLLASDPGRIVVYGIGVPLAFQSCFCLGTVSAEVKAGEITDFGASVMGLAADPSPYPELSTGGGTSDGRFLIKLCPVVDFGLPNATMHKVHESAAVEDIRTLARIYARVFEGGLAS